MIVIEIPTYTLTPEAEMGKILGLAENLERDTIPSKTTVFIPDGAIIIVNESTHKGKSSICIDGDECMTLLINADYETTTMIVQNAVNKAEKKA